MEVKYITDFIDDALNKQVLIYPAHNAWSPQGEYAPSLSIALDMIFKEEIDDNLPFITYVKRGEEIKREWGLYPYEYEDDFDAIRIIGKKRL